MEACRCCLSPGIHKDLYSTYMWLNIKEVYSEMLQECFNISLVTADNLNTAICEECIKFIRSSCNFKRQVIHNEEELLRKMAAVLEKDEKPMDLKSEPPFEGDKSDDCFTSDEDQKSIDMKMESSQEDTKDFFLSDTEDGVKPKKKKSSETKHNDTKSALYMEDLQALVTAVIEHSTIMPFRFFSSKYACFFCHHNFATSLELREHTTSEHKNPKMPYKLQNVKTPSKIKFDVTDITCKKCSKQLKDYTELLDHLIIEHNLYLKKEVSVYVTLFKLSDDGMSCLECGENFIFFSTMMRHTNRYHAKIKTFQCETCSQNFMLKADLANHIKSVHNTGVKKECNECNKTYSSELALSNHMRRMHCIEKLKCPKCPEVLRSPYLKRQHLAMVHDVKQMQFKCDQCTKIFTFRSKLIRHKGMAHYQEKNLTCEICGYKCFNKTVLNTHMVKHKGDRPFQCEICKECFPRRKSLDFHIRIHTNDKRYVCKECGKAFIQNSGLKWHVKTRH